MHNHIPQWTWDSFGQYWVYTIYVYIDDHVEWMDYNAYVFRDGDSYIVDADDNEPSTVGSLSEAMQIAESRLRQILPRTQ